MFTSLSCFRVVVSNNEVIATRLLIITRHISTTNGASCNFSSIALTLNLLLLLCLEINAVYRLERPLYKLDPRPCHVVLVQNVSVLSVFWRLYGQCLYFTFRRIKHRAQFPLSVLLILVSNLRCSALMMTRLGTSDHELSIFNSNKLKSNC